VPEKAKDYHRGSSRKAWQTSKLSSNGEFSNDPIVGSATTSTSKVVATTIPREGLDDDDAYPVLSLMTVARLVSNVVHEVNSPLGTAMSSSQTALRFLPPQFPPQLATCIERTISSVGHASDAVRSLVRFCCPDRSLLQAFDLRDVIRFTVLVAQSSESDKLCAIDLQLPPVPSVVLGNPIAIHMVIATLVWNAKESGASRVCVEIVPHADKYEICIVSNPLNNISLDTSPALTSPSEELWEDVHGMARQDWICQIVREHGGELAHVRRPDHTVDAYLRLPRDRQEVA